MAPNGTTFSQSKENYRCLIAPSSRTPSVGIPSFILSMRTTIHAIISPPCELANNCAASAVSVSPHTMNRQATTQKQHSYLHQSTTGFAPMIVLWHPHSHHDCKTGSYKEGALDAKGKVQRKFTSPSAQLQKTTEPKS